MTGGTTTTGLHGGAPPLPDAAARIVSLVRETLRAGLARTGGRGLPTTLDATGPSPVAADLEATALLLLLLPDALSDDERAAARDAIGGEPRGVLARSSAVLRPWIGPSAELHAAIADDPLTVADLAARHRDGVPTGAPTLANALRLRGLDELAVVSGDDALGEAIDARLTAWTATAPGPRRVDRLAALALVTSVAVERGRMDDALRLAPVLARSLGRAGGLDPVLGPDATRTVPVLVVLEGLLRAGVGSRDGARTLWPIPSPGGEAATTGHATPRPWVPRVAWTDDGADRGDETGTRAVLGGLHRAGEVEVGGVTDVDAPRVRLDVAELARADVVVDSWLSTSTTTAEAFHAVLTRTGRPLVLVLTPSHLRSPGPGRARSTTADRLRDAVTRASVVVAPGRHLAQWAVDAGARDVVLIPPAVEGHRPPRARPWRGRIAVPGADAPAIDLELLPAIVSLIEDTPGMGAITWVSLGTPPPGLDGRTIEARDVAPGPGGLDVDLALVPLDARVPLPERSLQPVRRLAAAGIPIVASRGNGVETILTPSTDACVVDDHGWADAVTRLRDDGLRHAMARAAWDRVVGAHPPERAARLWLRVLRVARELAGDAGEASGEHDPGGPATRRRRSRALRSGTDQTGTGTATR